MIEEKCVLKTQSDSKWCFKIHGFFWGGGRILALNLLLKIGSRDIVCWVFNELRQTQSDRVILTSTEKQEFMKCFHVSYVSLYPCQWHCVSRLKISLLSPQVLKHWVKCLCWEFLLSGSDPACSRGEQVPSRLVTIQQRKSPSF